MAVNYKVEWPMSLNAPPDSLEAKQPPVDNGLDVPDPSRYSSREFMKLEWERLWPRVWLLAGVTSDIPESGDYVVFEHGHEEIRARAPAERRHQGVLQRLPASRQSHLSQRARQRREIHLRVPRLAVQLQRQARAHHG